MALLRLPTVVLVVLNALSPFCVIRNAPLLLLPPVSYLSPSPPVVSQMMMFGSKNVCSICFPGTICYRAIWFTLSLCLLPWFFPVLCVCACYSLACVQHSSSVPIFNPCSRSFVSNLLLSHSPPLQECFANLICVLVKINFTLSSYSHCKVGIFLPSSFGSPIGNPSTAGLITASSGVKSQLGAFHNESIMIMGST